MIIDIRNYYIDAYSLDRIEFLHIFIFQGPRKLSSLVVPETNEAILLRVLTLLATLAHAVSEDNLNPSVDLPPEDKAAAPDTM